MNVPTSQVLELGRAIGAAFGEYMVYDAMATGFAAPGQVASCSDSLAGVAYGVLQDRVEIAERVLGRGMGLAICRWTERQTMTFVCSSERPAGDTLADTLEAVMAERLGPADADAKESLPG